MGELSEGQQMMPSITPPLGGPRPSGDQGCGRLTIGGHCDQPAVVHIAWNSDIDNGVVCPEHLAEARKRWAFYDHHPLTPFCTQQDQGMVWVASWEHPPGYCAEPIADQVVYIETYADQPAEVPQ